MLSEQTSATQLYKGIVFYAAGQVSAVTQARLRSGGGKKVHYLSSLVTHTVVGKGVDTVEVEEAEELFEVPVVSEEWVRLSSRCGVILPVRGFRVSGDQIFSGVVVKMERLSIVDMERIWAMVTWYGGRVVTGGDDVTHLVSGCHSVDEGQQVCSVTPDWVVDSVMAGKRMDERMYSAKMVLVSGNKRHIHVKSTPSKYSKQENEATTIIVDDHLDYSEKTSSPLAPQRLIFPREWSCKVHLDSNLDDNGDASKPFAKEKLESITEDVLGESFDQEEEFTDVGCGMQDLETSFTSLQLSPKGGNQAPVSKMNKGVDKDMVSDEEGSPLQKENRKKQIKTRRKSLRLLEKKSVSTKGESEKLNLGQGDLPGREVLKRVDVRLNSLWNLLSKDAAESGNYVKADVALESLIVKNKLSTNTVKGSVKFDRELLDHDDFYHDQENPQDKLKNRRRSVRLLNNPKVKEETSNRRRSIRLMQYRE